MKLKWLTLFVLIVNGGVAAENPESSASSPTVRVAFWNIQWFPGRHPNASTVAERQQITAVQRDMRTIDADVIGLSLSPRSRDLKWTFVRISPRAKIKTLPNKLR